MADDTAEKKPAYVPGFHWDIFVSYAHQSNQPEPGQKEPWITDLKSRLEGYLTGKLETPPNIFFDESDLPTVGAYPEELKNALHHSALLLTINCEPYFASSFCALERKIFQDVFGQDPRTEENDLRRIVEVYKSLLANGIEPKIQADSNGFWFCGKPDPKKLELTDTFVPGDDEYDDEYTKALRRMGNQIAKLLFQMRKERSAIFVSPPNDAADPKSQIGNLYERLRKELSQEFRVIPLPGSNLSDAENLNNSLLSVHFISQTFDKATVDRVAMAREIGRPILVIVAPGLDERNPVRELLKKLEEDLDKAAQESPNCLRLMDWKPTNQLSDLVTLIRPLLPAPGDQVSPGRSFVYLICHPRDLVDDEVQRLCSLVKSSPLKFEVSRLEQSTVAAVIDHINKFATCDGILLVWGKAQKDWFEKYQGEIKEAPAFRSGRPVSSKSVLLDPKDEEKIKVAKSLVSAEDLWDGFDAGKIAEFLKSLKPLAQRANAQ